MDAKALALVRERDGNWTDEDIQRHLTSIAYMPVQDRRALLAHVDALAAELAEVEALLRRVILDIGPLLLHEIDQYFAPETEGKQP